MERPQIHHTVQQGISALPHSVTCRSICPDSGLQQCAVSWCRARTCSRNLQDCNMISRTLCSPGHTRRCTMDKPEIIPQRNDSGIFPSTNYKEIHKSRQTRFHNDLNCPVCLQTATSPVETNCGHLFCGPCVIEYWKHDPWLGAISCPLCRQKVHTLYDDLCEVPQQEKTSETITKDIRQYNNRFSGKQRPLSDYLYDLPSLLHLALRRIFTMGGLVWIFCLRIVVCSFGAIICFSSPYAAAIPDPLCGILSAIDDLVVIFLLLVCMINISQQFHSEGMTMAHTAAQSVLSES